MKTAARLIIFSAVIIGLYIYTNPNTVTVNSLIQKLRTIGNQKTAQIKNSIELAKPNQKTPVFRLALVSDSHEDTQFYPQILKKVTDNSNDMIIHLGDLVNAGSTEALTKAKELLDQTGLSWYALPGDHDHTFWPTRNLSAYSSVFGQDRFYIDNPYFLGIGVNNSNREQGITPENLEWLKDNLNNTPNDKRPKFIFIHIALTHPIFSRSMLDQNETTKEQAKEMLILAKEKDIDEIFNGDLHSYSRFKQEGSNLTLTSIGASGSYKNPVPQFIQIVIYDDFSYDVESLTL